MATTYVDVLLQVDDPTNIEKLSGGKIYTYEAGTTTPLATYQDLAGSTANTNPVILDSAGMAVIRQTDGVAYKWVVFDADDNELFTRDNITVGLSPGAAGSDYLVHISFEGTPGAQGFMGGHIYDRSVTHPIDFEGAQGWVETPPAAEFVISLRRSGTEVGTATIDTAGAFTFATTGGATVACTSGQRLVAYGPDTPGTAANFVLTIPGAIG